MNQIQTTNYQQAFNSEHDTPFFLPLEFTVSAFLVMAKARDIPNTEYLFNSTLSAVLVIAKNVVQLGIKKDSPLSDHLESL